MWLSKGLMDSCDRMTVEEKVIAEEQIALLDIDEDLKFCMIAVLHNPYQINKSLEDRL